MKFALITEGPSEHRIIKHIITKYFKNKDTEINQIQPKIVNDKQETTGGWNEVLKYCEREDINDIFVENDYLIIQIDSDQSQIKPFSVSHTNQSNKTKTVEELYVDIKAKLKELIKPEIIELHNDKIFFAICIHTIECWLLPLYCTENHKSDTIKCIVKLNKELRKHNIHSIPAKEKNNPTSIRTYETIIKAWKKKTDIVNSARYNSAFKKFIDSLNIIKVF
ncbi:MAG: hypothetical protein LH629_01980 [Ignavibacteria bacterium]|nr:hypothetical protein [Ignavibacteria bacterium]